MPAIEKPLKIWQVFFSVHEPYEINKWENIQPYSVGHTPCSL